MESSIVIKVKYEDTLRRFNARIVNDELDLNMNGLREKIVTLFKFAPDTQLNFTYNDEDNDVVALVDDEDLRDVVRQALNPLRITVSSSTATDLNSSTQSTGSSDPSFSPPLQKTIQNLNSNVSEILKALPEQLREPLSKLSSELAKKASVYGPSNLDEITSSLSKMGLQYLNQLSVVPPTGESKKSVEAHKDSDGLENLVAPAELTSGGSTGRPTSKTKKVLQKSKSPLKNVAVNVQGVPQAPGLNSSFAASGSGNSNSNLPVHPVFPSDSMASARKQEASLRKAASLLKKTGETSGVKYFSGHSFAANGTSSGIFAANGTSSGISDYNWNTYAEDMGIENSASGFQYTHFPPFPSTSLNGSPFTGVPIASNTAIPHGAQGELLEKNYNYSHGIIHGGIICDGCEARPITGPRFKSKVRENYDLCSMCFAEMGNETDFIRIDHPVHLPRHPHKGVLHGMAYHGGIICDGCEADPITGPRFKSKVRENYDLCSVCFAEMGNKTDFIRIDHPVHLPRHPHKGSISHHGRVHPWKIPRKFKSQSTVELDSRFIVDVNIPDGTVMPPLTRFTKVWRMRNNGTTIWPQGTRLVWIGGDGMASSPSILLEISAAGIQVDEELNVAVNFVAPQSHGRHISYWRMALPTGQKFGQRVWVLIEVDAFLKGPMHEAGPGFNLNVPPASESVAAPEFDVPKSFPVTDQSFPESNMSNASAKTADVRIPELAVDKSVPKPNLSKASVESIEPAGNVEVSIEHEATNLSKASVETNPADNVQGSKEQEAKFPIDDTLLVGRIKYDAGQSSSVSYPIVDGSTVTAPSAPREEANVNAILKELEEMGFKHAALNKEILESNEYNLEQTIDALCGDSEWDPILEELEEMGFDNRDTNKRLLRKNDGSIKRVVMDLIAGETEKF